MDTSAPGFVTKTRKTKETQVSVSLRINGTGETDISTGAPFLDHMLVLFAAHGLFDLGIRASGDTDVDFHHTVEDVGLVLGEALSEALGDRAGLRRYGQAGIPMDEALAQVALDLSKRPFLVFNVPFSGPSINGFDTQLFKEFFRALVQRGGLTCHILVPYGENDHHKIEAAFKAFGRALDLATQKDSRVQGVPSSKGVL